VVADFIGTQRCKLDSKGRLQVPAGFRRTLGLEGGETFVLSKGFDKGLLLFAPEGWRTSGQVERSARRTERR
jgi:DNA-binding transcriptional regulator/RsmH inhibitor MraZ